MLIRFTVSNFRSFNEEVVFSMIPGSAQKHVEHLISDHESEIDTLRFAMLYGANASGKSNLVRAIDFARTFIIDGTRPKQNIAVEPFRLRAGLKQPSRFEFEFIVGTQAYAYGFLVDRRSVHEEWLYAVNAKNEYALFERKTVNRTEVEATFAKSLDGDQQFLEFVSRATRANELLLTKLVENDVEQFDDIYTWFQRKLTIVFPHSRHRGVEIGVYQDQAFSQALGAYLKSMNTGIEEVCTRAVDIDTIDFPVDLILDRRENEHIGQEESGESIEQLAVISTPQRRYLLHRNEEDELEAHVLSTRRRSGNKSIEFELHEESDGTQRLLDLFPILHSAEDQVFIIDELERSLHPNLVRNFIQQFLGKKNQNQLIVTTHESTLLDLTIFRRDEIWFIEKTPEGASRLYSLEEFKPRHDLDIRKGYLQGRFGAIPVFGSYLQETPMEE